MCEREVMIIDTEFEIGEIGYPNSTSDYQLTQQDIEFGEALDPLKRIAVFSPDEFESFIQLWVKESLKKEYSLVTKCGGAGDKGRDVIAYFPDKTWDNYQCKHYGKALSHHEIWLEIGKLCYYTFNESYTVPKSYYFVCSKGITPKLIESLEKPKSLKREFLEKWDTHCKTKITQSKSIELTDEFRDYILKIDFSIFKHVTPLDLVASVKDSIGYASIFGGGLKKKREVSEEPPAEIASSELIYTDKIFEAYSDYLGMPVTNENDLIKQVKLKSHFERQRRHFYTVETLLRLERDIRTFNDKTIVSVKDEIYDSVIDTVDSDYSNGYERLKSVTDKARKCDLSAHPLLKVTYENDKHGLCHHLANENRISWVE